MWGGLWGAGAEVTHMRSSAAYPSRSSGFQPESHTLVSAASWTRAMPVGGAHSHISPPHGTPRDRPDAVRHTVSGVVPLVPRFGEEAWGRQV